MRPQHLPALAVPWWEPILFTLTKIPVLQMSVCLRMSTKNDVEDGTTLKTRENVAGDVWTLMAHRAEFYQRKTFWHPGGAESMMYIRSRARAVPKEIDAGAVISSHPSWEAAVSLAISCSTMRVSHELEQ